MSRNTFIKLSIASVIFTLGCHAYAANDVIKDGVYNNNASLYSSNIQARLSDEDQDGVINGRDLCPGTAPNAAVNNDGCPTTSAKLLSMDLKVLFDSGKADVKPTFYSQIKRLASFLQDHPKSDVEIKGYTDNVGNAEYNQDLSQRRATAIANVLVDTFRIDKDRVKAIGYGEKSPISTNETDQGRERNRRVVAEVYAKQKFEATRWTVYSVDSRNSTASK